MGNWAITINGIGCHHNQNSPTDADKMTEKFVNDLLKAGHSLSVADFTYGSKVSFLLQTSNNQQITKDNEKYFTVKGELIV
ncbi:MAG: hypothetical protein AABY22_19185 [Nanoarchaeota archaeon]